MSEIKIHHPHDEFFKRSLSNLTVAKDLLQARLSPVVTQRIQWDSLCLSNKSYTDQRLVQLRFLKYNVALLTEYLAQNEKGENRQHLPIILNLCIYTGKITPYPYALDLYDCFADPILARAEMFKPLSLVDLGQIEEDELAKNGTADLLEMLLKRSRTRTFLKWMTRHAEEIQKLLNRFYGICGILYMLGTEEKRSAEELL